MARQQPFVTLNTGAKMPLMGFGTLMESLDVQQNYVVRVVKDALDVGYRHLDTARVYNTEAGVGQAVRENIQEGLIKREDVFITTKLWRTDMRRAEVVPSLKKSLKLMGLDYVDLFLVHWPTAFKSGEEHFPKDDKGNFLLESVDLLETWKGMEECYDLGLTKAIGLSNCNSKQIQNVCDNGRVKPANLQIEVHPFLANTKLIKFCEDKGISTVAYTPLAGFNPGRREEMKWPTIFTDETILALAKKYKRSPAQIALRNLIQRGVGVAPKSSKKQRMLENVQALDFELEESDLKQLASLDQNMRLNVEFPEHPDYPFHEEF